MVNFKHFTLDDRSHIEHDLNANINISAIAISIGRSHSSIQREIDKHVLFIRDYGFTKTNDCAFADSCMKHHVCSSACTYKKGKCKFCGNCNSLFHCSDYVLLMCAMVALILNLVASSITSTMLLMLISLINLSLLIAVPALTLLLTKWIE